MQFEDVEVVTGDTRRMPYAVGTFASRAAVMSGSAIHLAAKRAKEKVLKIAAEALEADEEDLEIVDGVVSVKGSPGTSIDLGTVVGAVQPAALRLRRGVQGGDPVLRRRPGQAAGGRGRGAGPGGQGLLLARARDVRLRHARRDRRDRPGDRRDHDPQVRRRPRLRPPDQPDDRRGPDPRRRRAGRRGSALRADGLRRVRAAAQRVVHGLPDALRHRGPRRHRHRPPRDAVAAQPARHQGRGRGRRDPVGRGLRGRHRGRRGHHRSRRCRSRRPSCTPCDWRTHEDQPDPTSSPSRSRQVWDALLDPRVLVAHHPRLRAARRDRRQRLRHDRHRRRRRDQGHLPGLLHALGPRATRVAGDAALRRRRARAPSTRPSRSPSARPSPASPRSTTTPTRSSAAWSAASASGC